MLSSSDIHRVPSPSMSWNSDLSMDRTLSPRIFSPRILFSASTSASLTSDESVDKASSFKIRTKLETTSPAPTCSSFTSDQSVNGNIKRRMRPGPIPSPCWSLKSDWSMGEPPVFSKDLSPRTRMRPGPIPSPCWSFKSDWSMGEPPVFSKDLSPRTRMRPGPIPSPCWSFKSDWSMGEPPVFSKENLSPCIRDSYTSLLMEDYLRCSVCKDVLKEPVSIPCGHSFCKTCIQSYWEKPTHERHCFCPQCKKRFKAFPELNLNIALDAMLKQAGFSPALPAQRYPGPGDVACDICTGKKVRAVKWCQTCSVAYCEIHVRQHYTVEALQRHTLLDATEYLEMRTCQLHHRALKFFCKTNQVFLCRVCVMEEHEDHGTVLAKGGSHVTKANLTADVHQVTVHLLKSNEELKAKVKNLKRAESELSHLSKRFCRGLQDSMDFTSEFVEVAALGRKLDLGMLYDCCNDSFSSDIILWEKNLISSMTLSIPRPQTDVRIFEKDTLQDRLAALDLSVSLKASVLSGLVEMTGASAFINHPIQSELQDLFTLHYRTSTRLDMLSHELLHNGFRLSVNGSTRATHVVVAVLYGSQAFFVFDNKKEKSAENTDVIKKMIASSSQTDLLSKEALSLLYERAAFNFNDVLRSPVDSTLQNVGAVPLKVWLYPLKNLGQTSACVAKHINEDQLCNMEKILEKLKMDISFCQHLMCVEGVHDVFRMFPDLREALSELSSLLQQYQSNFQRRLASCIKTIRETGAKEEEENLQDLLDRNNQLLFSSFCTNQWLRNKNAQVRALIQCRSANIRILNAQNDLERFVQDCQADRVLCFIFTSLEGEDLFLSALRQKTESADMAITTLRISDTSQKILSDLQSFILNKETSQCVQETMFIAASVPDLHLPGSSIYLYQSGNLVSRNVKLDLKPDPPEIITVQQTRVTIKLQSAECYRVEYRAVKEDGSPVDMKWRVVPYTGENCVVSGLAPATDYQLRYALMESDGMSNYSTVAKFQTASRDRPGPPTVIKLNKESLYIAWQKAETDEDSIVLYYIVEYLEAGLEGWQSIQTDGPMCEFTITLLYSTCYRVRVSAVYGNGDISIPSEETKVPVRVWSIDLSKRKASIFLEVLQCQTTKKSVKLRDCTDEESEVRSFLQCLSCISQLSIDPPQTSRESLDKWRNKMTLFLMNLCLQAAVHQKETVQETIQKLPVCYLKTYREQSAFLLDLYSHVKDYEIQTGECVRPALQSVYQTLPEVWSINLSKRKVSLFLELLKLQRVKKVVELRGWSEEESEMRSLLQCLPYISQLSLIPLQPQRECRQERKKRVRRFLLDLCLQAALHQKEGIQKIVEKCFKTDKETSDFLLFLYSHVRDYETQTGRTVLPALQAVYESLPKIWSINLSDKKFSLFLEVLKLQPVKKAVELRGWSEEESEMRILLQCLPYISQLRFSFIPNGKRRKLTTLGFLVKLIAGVAECSEETGESFSELLASLCNFRTFSFPGDDQDFDNVAHCNILLDLYLHLKDYEAETGRSVVLPALQSVYKSVPEVWTTNLSDKKASLFLEVLKLQKVKKAVELTGWSNEKRKMRSFFQCLPHISQLRLCSDVLVRMAQAMSLRSCAPVTLDELLLTKSHAQQPDGTPCKILSSLSFLLRQWKIQCLNLTDYKMAAQSLLDLLNHQGALTIRFSEETLQKLVAAVYEVQDENITRRFLQNLGGDLTSCSLSWDVIHCFLQHHTLIVDFKRSTIAQENIQDLLPVLNKVHLRGLKSSFLLSIMRELYEAASADSVSSLLSSTKNCINLQNRKLNSADCAALCFTLEHCTGVSLNLLWTSVPDGELESIVPLLRHVSHLRVDRLLLLRLLHCCSVHEFQQEALLSALHHKLDFSCHDALDLTADTTTNGLVLSGEDCRVISMAIQRAYTHIQLTLHDCEIEEAGVEQLFHVLHTVTLHCSKALLRRFLSLVPVGSKADHVRGAVALSQALRNKVDLSETQLNLHDCKSLALILEYSEGLSELDLSHCQLTDHELELLMPHVHKTCILDLSHNHITDVSARNIYDIVSQSSIQTVCLFNNRITELSLFAMDQRFEIW